MRLVKLTARARAESTVSVLEMGVMTRTRAPSVRLVRIASDSNADLGQRFV